VNTHIQAIETCWENLLESIKDAQSAAASEKDNLFKGITNKLETLQAAVSGLSHAWVNIRNMYPADTVVTPIDNESSDFLPQSAYLRPLAEILLQSGGSVRTNIAIAKVGKQLEKAFKKGDREPLEKTGQIRWMINVRYARLTLKHLGIILADQQTGVWTLTDAGKRWAASNSALPKRPFPQPNPNQLELF
jgi:hypothetical protein